MIPPWITPAVRMAAAFEENLAKLQAALGKRAPSREVILEAARRDPRRSALDVVMYWRAHWKGPEL